MRDAPVKNEPGRCALDNDGFLQHSSAAVCKSNVETLQHCNTQHYRLKHNSNKRAASLSARETNESPLNPINRVSNPARRPFAQLSASDTGTILETKRSVDDLTKCSLQKCANAEMVECSDAQMLRCSDASIRLVSRLKARLQIDGDKVSPCAPPRRRGCGH